MNNNVKNNTTKKPYTNELAKTKTLVWKLEVAVASLATNGAVPNTFILKVLSDNQKELPSTRTETKYAYDIVSPREDKASSKKKTPADNKLINRKNIDRLGFIYYELLNLLDSIPTNKLLSAEQKFVLESVIFEYVTNNKLIETIPASSSDFIKTEIAIRGALYKLLPNELDVLSSRLGIGNNNINGSMSRHLYNLSLLGAKFETPEAKLGIVALAKNQLIMIDILMNKKLSLSDKKTILKTAHWQPNSLEMAEKVYADTVKLLSLFG